MKNTIRQQTLTPGNIVTFNTDKIDLFKTETRSSDPTIRQYRQLILARINQAGKVVSFAGNMLTVSFPDGLIIPVPVKYFILLPANFI